MLKQLRWTFSYIFRDSKKHKLRLLIGVVSIGLSIGLLVALNATIDTISHSYVDLILENSPDYDFNITPSNSLFTDYSQIIDKIDQVEAVEGSSPRIVLNSFMIIEYEGSDIFQLPAVLIGLNITRENELNLGNFIPRIENNIGENKCLLVGEFGRNVQTSLNENLSINYFFLNIQNPNQSIQRERLEIKQVVDENKKLPEGFNLVIVDLNLIHSWINQSNICTEIIGKFSEKIYSVTDPEGSIKKAQEIAIVIQSIIGIDDYIVSLPKANAIREADFTGARLLMNFIGLILLALATLLIYSLNTISIEERTKEFAMLRTIGVSDRKILAILLMNQSFIVFVGIVVGYFIGLGLTSLITNMLFASINVKIAISTGSILFSILVGSLSGMVSSIPPSRNLLRKNIVVSLEYGRSYTQEYSIKRERTVSLTMGIIGLIVASIGSTLFIVFPLLDIIDEPLLNQILFLSLLFSFLLGSVLLVVGVFSPLIENIITGILSLFRVTRKQGIMVRSFLQKNRRRNVLSSIIFALSLAFILYISTSQNIGVYTLKENLRHYYGADIVISGTSEQYLNPSIVKFLENHENVSSVSYTTTGDIRNLIGCSVRLGDMALFQSVFISNIYSTPSNLGESLYREPILTSGAFNNLYENNNTTIISRSISNELNLKINDSVRLQVFSSVETINFLYGKNMNLTIIGIADRIPGFTDVHIAKKYASFSAIFVGNLTWNNIMKNKLENTDQLQTNDYIERIFVKAKDKEVIEGIQTDLFLQFGTSIQPIRVEVFLERLKEDLQRSREQFSVILSLSLIIAFFAIFSSTQTSIIESINEIGIIKSIGLKDKDITIIFLLQSIILTGVSSILGGLVGYNLAYLSFIQNAIAAEFPIVLIPIDSIIPLIYLIAMLLTLLGTYLPIRSSIIKKIPSEIIRRI